MYHVLLSLLHSALVYCNKDKEKNPDPTTFAEAVILLLVFVISSVIAFIGSRGHVILIFLGISLFTATYWLIKKRQKKTLKKLMMTVIEKQSEVTTDTMVSCDSCGESQNERSN